MKTEYTIIEPNGDETLGEVDWPEVPEYHKHFRPLMQEIFGENIWTEHVTVLNPADEQYTDMFVDEDGRSRDAEHNPKATAIYRYNALKNDPGVTPDQLWDIVGKAVLFHRRIWF